MKYKVLTLTLAALLSQASIAATIHAKPNACPSLAAIKSIGLNNAVLTRLGWLGYSINQFDTNAEWTFATFIDGNFDNPVQALKQGNKDLSLLKETEGPVQGNGKDEWDCMYSGSGADAFAITPPISNNEVLKYIK